MAIEGLGILIEMVCCRWGDHCGGVLVNLRRQHGGGGDLGDAAAVSLPVRLVSKQMPIRHTDLGRMLVVIWSLHSKTAPPTAAKCSSFQNSERPPEDLILPGALGEAQTERQPHARLLCSLALERDTARALGTSGSLGTFT